MARPRTGFSYADRVERVIDHVADHLDDLLGVEKLAEVACFSPYHFHRIYRAVTGETVGDTVRRLRLHRAAVELTRTHASLALIGKRAGYGSLAAFSRAFSSAYGRPPSAYRKGKSLVLPSRSNASGEIEMYDVTIDRFAPVRLAGVEHRGDYHAIGKAFERLVALAGPRGILGPQKRSFGIYYDDPESVPARDLRSFAGISVGPEFKGDQELKVIELPAAMTARLIHRGPYAELEQAYRHLYKGWLPASGREPADAPCFEEYLNDCRTLPPTEWLTAVHMPLASTN
jgi:AraC family transcriptional regulator